MTHEERVARNQAWFREANEDIERARRELDFGGDRVPFLCECADQQCTQLVRLTPCEYRQVREDGARFAVAPGHETGEFRTVDGGDAFAIVEKLGEAGRIAKELR